VVKSVALEGGLRGQYAPGAYAPLLLGSAAARWSPYESLSLKFNAAQGFRPPAFELTNGNDDPITNPFFHRQSNPNLRAERSLSLESEISALVPADGITIRNVAFRLGYQYTRLDDLIVFGSNGAPANANRRIMNSVELRSDLSLVGGHRFIFGYTFLVGEDLATGPLRNIPQHRFNLTLEARLSPRFHGFFAMTMTGRVEDLDRLPVQNMDGTYTATPSSVVVDRLPASLKVDCGVLASGLGGGHFDVAAYLNNALDSRYSIADPDFERRSAIYPITAPGLSAMLSVTTRM
jgi:outer membrane receptor protein involved in Fe transport